MTDPDRRRLRQILLGLALAVATVSCMVLARLGIGPLARDRPGDYSGVSPGVSPLLRGLAEPIAFTKGRAVAGSDDHWMGVTFRDARGVEREARYVFYWPPVGDHPGYTRVLLLGGEVPPSGPEEREFLGLLQRWYRRDPEARDLRARVERRDPSLGRTPFGWDGLTDPQAGKVVAAGMMKILEGRN